MIAHGHPLTFKGTISPNIAVNTILGMSVIRKSDLSLDFTIDIVTLGVLNIKPFRVVFKNRSCCMPNIGHISTTGARAL